jgi:Fe2+ transport system protein B
LRSHDSSCAYRQSQSNVGKTEIFNRLTGLSQTVENFPGVTVEKKAGRMIHKGQEIEVVDLPGTYSLSAHAVDELVARDYIVLERPDVIVDIVDGTNLERNLYLTLLLLEMDSNLVMALNRWDTVLARGTKIDLEKLSEQLGCPVVPTVAITGERLEDLKRANTEYMLNVFCPANKSTAQSDILGAVPIHGLE